MKKHLFVAIACIFIIPCIFAQPFSKYFGLANQDTVSFILTLRKPDIEVIDSYPQQITEISKIGENYKIILTTVNPYLNEERFAKMKEARYDKSQKYDTEAAKYLVYPIDRCS